MAYQITLNTIYYICKKYGAKQCNSATGKIYRKPTPKLCAEKICDYLKEQKCNVIWEAQDDQPS